MTSRLFYFALCAVFCSQLRAQESPFSNAGPLKVVVVDSVTLKDDTRGRTIETLVRYPSGPGSFPVLFLAMERFQTRKLSVLPANIGQATATSSSIRTMPMRGAVQTPVE